MTAIPTHCPHGAVIDIRTDVGYMLGYVDGCWTTAGAYGPRKFWCGAGEASKPQGVSLTEGEYLAAWAEALEENGFFDQGMAIFEARRAKIEAAHAEALILNAGDEVYDEAVRMNNISDGLDRLAAKYAETDGFYGWLDTIMKQAANDRTHDICNWCGGLAVLNDQGACPGCHDMDAYQPCGCLSNSTNAHRASCPDYLGEVPWSDRVDD